MAGARGCSSWYTSGALLGGAPLAQGTVYLFMKRRTAHVLSAILITYVVIAATFVLLSPINYQLVEPHRPSGRVLAWSWVRLFSPFVNTYAVIFLIGGAIVSAIRYSRRVETRYRFIGNVLIAIGAILPGIGGGATRMGYVEVLYVTELIGLFLIWLGYRFNGRGTQNRIFSPRVGVYPSITGGPSMPHGEYFTSSRKPIFSLNE